MRLLPTSMRWRLSAAIAVVSALVATALSLLVRTEFAQTQLSDARQLQDQRLQLVIREYALSGQAALGSELDASALPPELMSAVKGGNRATYLQRAADGSWIWAAAETDGKVLSLRSPYSDRDEALKRLDQVLLISSLGVVILSSVLGVLLVSRLSRRLRLAAGAARRVADGDMTARVRDVIKDRPRDEAAELAQAMDSMADALQERLIAEQRVTADIAHELRTPVTGLVTAAELLPPSRPAELVRDRVRVLRVLVEDILEVARLDTATERAELSELALAEFVRRRVAGVAPEAAVTVNEQQPARTDPRRLERVLVNLLVNATKHGEPPVEVTVDGLTVTVRDHGPGFSDDLLKEGPSRFRTGSSDRGSGHGLGLTIAVAQVKVLGGTLTLDNAEDGGARATLVLPDNT
ncbi:sensor histidine kinase [Kibdelosporangium phytohabitans]|uniref:Signal transduction histidine-protein kinase/phosphatase MprB n=1 Tax=Kibdelosporangium phytohabitans TaxID=860235 RepID=A0A0N9HUN3_9PSEU|nr:HAMP domain-containing sensor histidine kinase [Kibdelosporangium phytohabitans]ALG07249.1 histidine kinase [Kibdelosporangium phytohabitans]MBE1471892.1 signal transduction histidine kinase [Kibdelosporangium phytohabitans]